MSLPNHWNVFESQPFIKSKNNKTPSYHDCSCGLGCLTHMLTGLDFGLQVCRRVEILALVSAAAALDVIHANGYSVIDGVNHRRVTGVSKAAVCLPSSAVPSLELSAHLRGVKCLHVSGMQLLARGHVCWTLTSPQDGVTVFSGRV